MFLINKDSNEAISIPQRSFSDLDFKERRHLQEWIDKNPDILGENLLIIQKEFCGFSDTYERLDLLAIDEHGDLVIIENKLDDSGKDVVWQALKYASYCSSLTKAEIKEIYQKYLLSKGSMEDAENKILDFLDVSDFAEVKLNSGDQRIVLVAARFRKEVTSTVMWLMEHNVNIKCIKVTPYQNNDDIFLDTEQILPAPDTESFQMQLNLKKQDENKTNEEVATRHKLRYAFWSQALPELQKTADIYHNVSPTKDNWISGASGYSGIGYNSVVTLKSVRAELYIGKSNKAENKAIFDELYSKRSELDQQFDAALEWDRLNEKSASRISISLYDVGVDDKSKWPQMIAFLGDNIAQLRKVMAVPLQKAIDSLKNS